MAGLLGADQWPAVLSVFKSVTKSGPYMEKYVLEAFFVMNDAKDGLARMRQRYSAEIQSKYSTLWEVWTPGDPAVGTVGGGTINHAWAGGPLTLMSQYVAGIAPTQPGYDEFQVMPQLGDLTQVTANVASRKGAISVDIKLGPPFTMQVVVPTATVPPSGSQSTPSRLKARRTSRSRSTVRSCSAPEPRNLPRR